MLARVAPFQKASTKAVLCLVMALAADWLFFGQPLGWTVGLYSGLVLTLLVLTQSGILRARISKVLFFASALLVLQMINSPSVLPVALFVFAAAALIVFNKRVQIVDAWILLKNVLQVLLQTFVQWRRDIKLLNKISVKRPDRSRGGIRYAVVPALLSAVFIGLFLQANPVLKREWDRIDFADLWSPSHWLLVALIFYGFVGCAAPSLPKP